MHTCAVVAHVVYPTFAVYLTVVQSSLRKYTVHLDRISSCDSGAHFTAISVLFAIAQRTSTFLRVEIILVSEHVLKTRHAL